MLGLSSRAMQIAPSATMQLTAIVADMTRSGIDVVKLNLGEPDFDTPHNIVEACKRALDDGKTRYTTVSGVAELREAICDKLKKDNGVLYSEKNISFGTGAKQPLFNTLFVTVDPGDEVIIPSPCWVSYVEMVKLCGGVPVIVPCLEADGFSLDLEAIEKAVTGRTKAIIINTPNNPTGAVYTEEALRKLAAMALKHGFYIISDEVYEKLIYDGEKHFCIASISDDVKEISFIVNGFSKAYAMTGWRAGYVAGPAAAIAKINNVQGHTTTNACTFVQWACVEALRGPQRALAEMVAEFDKRRKYLVCALNDLGFESKMPKGAFYVMPNVSPLYGKSYGGTMIKNSNDAAEFMLREAQIAVVPGAAFCAPDNVRVAYSNSLENIKKAMSRLGNAIAKLG